MKKRWYAILALLALVFFFFVSKTSEYFYSMNYSRDTYNWMQTIQNIWFIGILIGICFAGYKAKRIVIPTICAALFICGCNAIDEGHYSHVYILEPAKVIAEEENLHEGIYDWVVLEYHHSKKYESQYYITQVSEQ